MGVGVEVAMFVMCGSLVNQERAVELFLGVFESVSSILASCAIRLSSPIAWSCRYRHLIGSEAIMRARLRVAKPNPESPCVGRATSLCFAREKRPPPRKHPKPCANILAKPFFLDLIASGSRTLHHGHTAKITRVDAFAVRRLPRDKQDRPSR